MGPFDQFPQALARLAEFDFAPRRIIQMATADTAGALASGFAADVLVVSGSPPTDIRRLADIELVIARGRQHRPSKVVQ